MEPLPPLQATASTSCARTVLSDYGLSRGGAFNSIAYTSYLVSTGVSKNGHKITHQRRQAQASHPFFLGPKRLRGQMIASPTETNRRRFCLEDRLYSARVVQFPLRPRIGIRRPTAFFLSEHQVSIVDPLIPLTARLLHVVVFACALLVEEKLQHNGLV